MSRASELLQCKLGPGDIKVLVRAETIIRDLELDLAQLNSVVAVLRKARDAAFEHADTAREERDSAI